MFPAPMTPLGARTPHAHPALTPVLAALSLLAITGVYLTLASLQGWWPLTPDASPSPMPTASPVAVEYRNEEYGLLVTLPESWYGFSTASDDYVARDTADNAKTELFVEIHIGHPDATAATPRQDIPIMVFTHDQWARIQREELSVGAAPIPPSELARNSTYVFALPARYNYAFPDGWEEVEAIIAAGPVTAFEPMQ